MNALNRQFIKPRLWSLSILTALVLSDCGKEQPPPARPSGATSTGTPAAPVQGSPSAGAAGQTAPPPVVPAQTPAAPPQASSGTRNVFGTATIKGRVIFKGTPPKIISGPPMSAFPVCAKAHSTAIPVEGSIIYEKADNAVPFTFVWLKEGVSGAYDPPKQPVVLDQKSCVYHPHVFGLMTGQDLIVKNSDNTAHNIHSLANKNTGFNFSQPTPGQRTLTGSQQFPRPEIGMKIKCDVHSWMSSWCNVVTHPFFDVSKSHYEFPPKDEQGQSIAAHPPIWGTFEIKQVPAGTYTLAAWHEKWGEVTLKVTVKDGETAEVTVGYEGR